MVLAEGTMLTVLHNARWCDFRKEPGHRIEYGILIYSSPKEKVGIKVLLGGQN